MKEIVELKGGEDLVERFEGLVKWFDSLPPNIPSTEIAINDISKGKRSLVVCRLYLGKRIGKLMMKKVVYEDMRTEKRKELADIFYGYGKDKERIEELKKEIEGLVDNPDNGGFEVVDLQEELRLRESCVGLSMERSDGKSMNTKEVREIRREYARIEGELKMGERMFTSMGDMLMALGGDVKRLQDRWKLDMNDVIKSLKKEEGND